MNNHREMKALYINIVCILLQIYAITIYRDFYGLPQFAYYTVISNYIALISSILLLTTHFTGKLKTLTIITRFTAMMMLVITFLIVVLVLVWFANPAISLFTGSSGIRHIIVPTLTVISYMFYECRIESIHGALPTFVISLVYSAIMVVLNYLGKVSGPYPFFMVRLFGWGKVIIYCFLILLAMIPIAWILYTIPKRIKQ